MACVGSDNDAPRHEIHGDIDRRKVLLCSKSGRTEAQANNDRNANPKRSVFNSS